jgi:peptidoglycan/LPS O-acetylase OafA/YrhL
MDTSKTPLTNSSCKYLIQSDLSSNSFDLIRLCLAVLVVFSHCFVIATGKLIDTEPGMIFTRNQTDIGGIAVDFFFVISGFLISNSFKFSKSFTSYLKKRILRICPAFYVAFLISILIVGPLGTISRSHIFGTWSEYYANLNLKDFLVDLITFQSPHIQKSFSYTPLANMVNESLWTIEYEFLCYLIIPVMAVCGAYRKKWINVCFFLTSYIILALQDFNAELINHIKVPSLSTKLVDPIYLPRFFVYFSAGIIFYIYRNLIVRNRFFAISSFIILISSCFLIKSINLTLPIFGSYLLFYCAYHPNIRFPNFSKNGDFSYGIYLYAWPIQQLAMLFLSKYLSPLSLFCIAIPIAFFAAFLSWNYIEKPFLKLKYKDVEGFNHALS